MALRRAIVAPDTPNIREVLTHEKNALLFSTDNMDISFPAAVEVFCKNTQLRHQLGTEARKTITERGFTWDNNARRVIDKFKEIGIDE
jgi:glycosyltransferase involved in cell wall biosynthesis